MNTPADVRRAAAPAIALVLAPTSDLAAGSTRRARSGPAAAAPTMRCSRLTVPARVWPSTVRVVHEHEHGEQDVGAAAQAEEWNARYRERGGAIWSGRPNGRLVAEVAAVAPGRALDVGCGEGADAIWLAQRGWSVTAIDVSEVAIGRAREASHAAGASIEWICGDVLRVPLPGRTFDLVSMQYPALPRRAGEPAVGRLLDTVRPGGLLLAVYHDLDDEHRQHMKSRGVDPADYVGADDLCRLLGGSFTVELHAVEPRVDPPPGTPHIADVVLRARRR
jgi:SAM-dependent methyltransferase